MDFRNAVVILTSNVGSRWIQELAGKGEEVIRERVMEELRREFRPEFLNRLDEIVLFHSLGKEELSRIVDIMLRELNDRLSDRKIKIALTPAAKVRIAEIGFDPAYGARPLRRALQKRVEDPFAMRILEGEFPEGDRVTVDVDPKGGFTFTRSAS